MIIDDVDVLFTTPAHTLEDGDQIIVDDLNEELFIIHSIHETDDIDEIVVKGENLTDPTNNEISLFADSEYRVWSL